MTRLVRALDVSAPHDVAVRHVHANAGDGGLADGRGAHDGFTFIAAASRGAGATPRRGCGRHRLTAIGSQIEAPVLPARWAAPLLEIDALRHADPGDRAPVPLVGDLAVVQAGRTPVSGLARGQGAERGDLAVAGRANALFLDGNELFKQGLVGKAAEHYRSALELWEHPAFHFNLGVSLMNLDQPIESHDHFVRSREHGPVPIGDDKYAQAEVYINLLRSQLAEIEVICAEPGADVAVDGRPVLTCPGSRRVLVRPGGHRLEATKPRYEPDIQQAVLGPGDGVRVTLAPQVPEYLATTRRWPAWIPWTVAGAGAALLVGAGSMDARSVLSLRRFDRAFDERCSGPLGCRPEEISGALDGQLDRARIWQWAARVTYVAGGTALVTSSVLLYLNRERLVRRRGFIDESPGVSFGPLFAPRAAGVSAQLRF